MGVEFEIKFRATPEVQAQILQDIPGARRTIAMQTTYFDTPDKALSSRYYTLRQRMENDISICTLKYPTQDEGRGEFELPCDDILDAISELAWQSGITHLPELTAGGIVAVCGAKFTRTAITVTWLDATLELALDVGVLTGGSKEIPLCEVEVELKSGSREAARSYAARLAALYGLTLEKGSKFRRALALAQSCEEA